MSIQISIIIPVLNEEDCIACLLDHLKSNLSQKHAVEIILVDGGSTDRTCQRINDFVNESSRSIITLLNSTKGRAIQMVKGAQQASGKILYFLHADSFPPEGFDDLILDAISNNHPAGCFRMRFDSNHLWLKFISWFTRFNWRASRGGDQSLYITSELYDQIGGFNEQMTIFEDYDLINKLYRIDSFHVIQKTLVSSERRYRKKGVFRLQLVYLLLYWKRYRGASHEELKNIYMNYAN